MTTKPPVRIGFVGVGTMGQCAHLRHYATLPDCQVVALAELRAQTGQAVAARYGIPACYRDARAMLAAEQLDALVASQPFTRHGVILDELLAADLPIFIEKPLAWSVPVGERLAALAQQRRSRIMIGYHKRCDPAVIRAKAEIAHWQSTGVCGQLRYVRVTMPPGDWISGGFVGRIDAGDPPPNLPGDPRPDDLDEAAHRRYILFVNYYIHQVNLLRHLLGEDYQVQFADAAGVLLVGRSASGVTCTLEMAPYQTTHDWQESALVCFERGWLRIDLPAPLEQTHAGTLTIMQDDPQQARRWQPILPAVPAMRQQAQQFLAFVRGEAPAPCSPTEALRDLRLTSDYFHLKEQSK